VIAVAATIALALAVGAAAERRHGAGAQRVARATLAAMLAVLVPIVVFFNLARLEFGFDAGVGIGLAYVAVILTGLAAARLGRGPLALGRPASGSLIVASIQGNTGYLGLPLVVALLGADRLGEAVAYDTLVSAPVLLLGCFGVGAAYGSRAGVGARERLRAFALRNPPLLAAVAGLLVPDALAPDAAVDASRILVVALLPLGFFAVGVTLAADSRGAGGRILPPLSRPVAAALALRLVLAPALLAALAALLIDLPAPYLLLAAMPSGINGLTVAHGYGLDQGLVAGAIAWSTAVVIVAGLALTAL